jgi:(2Fe-2S) ferredoxin
VTSPAFRCAEAARDRDDPLLGTAPVSAAYLLIEHPGPWRFDALAGAEWSAEVVAAIAAAVRECRGRVLLIRRPGRRRPRRHKADDWAWAVVRVGVGTRWGTWHDERDLLAAAAALRAASTLEAAPAGPARPEPVLLVCAHGVHDTCCALRGRLVAAALADRWAEETWECSHIGGDRFAANLVMLPDGIYYGGLDAESAPRVVADHLGGQVAVAHLRGSVRWPPVAQVAVGEVHRRLGPYAADAVRPEAWTAYGPGRWLVEVASPGDHRHLVEVVAEARPAAVLTCAATRATSASAYRVASIRADPSPEQ